MRIIRRIGLPTLLAAAYLIAAPGAVNPAAPEEAAAMDNCTGSGHTLSVRAGGGRSFFCQTGFDNASASCGTLTQLFGPIAYRFDSGSCLGQATFSWETGGTPHVQSMKIEPNGNEPPECDPIRPGTTVAGVGIGAELSMYCMDADFDGSGQDEIRSSTTDPLHGSVEVFPSNNTYFEYTIDFEETLLLYRCDDSFAITAGDDYSPNPKSLPPVNVFVDNHAQRPPGICPEPSGEATSAEATGQRDTALNKCKKKHMKNQDKKQFKKCKKNAKKLPV
jgi:hypothetical protein